ncbi:MAG TPA: SDR family NAD(P)-dependent oxidoreductase [Nocardioidaceae bacterium]|nr:SDR family NAD(P)-dependent oxidoreductase [Nocardioidaceae bacterium]
MMLREAVLGSVAVVTGAGSGIGRAIACGLAERGSRVVAADLDWRGAEDTAAPSPDLIVPLRVDVADRSSVDELRDRVLAEVGVPDVLVNAAGWDRSSAFVDIDAELVNKIVAINYLGQVHVCSAFLPAMIEAAESEQSTDGRIVNIASDAGRVGSAGESVYAGAKGGVIALSKSLARETARHRITVNCVCPGPTDTPLFNSFPEKLREALVRAIPMRRPAQPEEVAAAVLFFASESASFVTGQVLSVSGGLTMAG